MNELNILSFHIDNFKRIEAATGVVLYQYIGHEEEWGLFQVTMKEGALYYVQLQSHIEKTKKLKCNNGQSVLKSSEIKLPLDAADIAILDGTALKYFVDNIDINHDIIFGWIPTKEFLQNFRSLNKKFWPLRVQSFIQVVDIKFNFDGCHVSDIATNGVVAEVIEIITKLFAKHYDFKDSFRYKKKKKSEQKEKEKKQKREKNQILFCQTTKKYVN